MKHSQNCFIQQYLAKYLLLKIPIDDLAKIILSYNDDYCKNQDKRYCPNFKELINNQSLPLWYHVPQVTLKSSSKILAASICLFGSIVLLFLAIFVWSVYPINSLSNDISILPQETRMFILSEESLILSGITTFDISYFDDNTAIAAEYIQLSSVPNLVRATSIYTETYLQTNIDSNSFSKSSSLVSGSKAWTRVVCDKSVHVRDIYDHCLSGSSINFLHVGQNEQHWEELASNYRVDIYSDETCFKRRKRKNCETITAICDIQFTYEFMIYNTTTTVSLNVLSDTRNSWNSMLRTNTSSRGTIALDARDGKYAIFKGFSGYKAKQHLNPPIYMVIYTLLAIGIFACIYYPIYESICGYQKNRENFLRLKMFKQEIMDLMETNQSSECDVILKIDNFITL